MAHSLSKNWIHLVFRTKNNQPLIAPDIENTIYNILKNELIDQGCFVESINGMPDHIHILFLLPPKKALADVVKHIKGAGSYKINKKDLIEYKFSWQKGYGAFSVSESQVHKVGRYIDTQKEHHKKISFQDEYNQFLKLHGLDENR